MRDLASEFRAQGHNPVVLAPLEGLKTAWLYEEHDGVGVMRLRAPAIKHGSYVRRTLAELALPFAMMWGLWRSPLRGVQWDRVVWWAPSIFLGPLVWWIKRRSQ